MLHDFQLAEQRVRLWQRNGESYEHILMKALGFAMFAGQYPTLEIEVKIGLRYKPDLVARNPNGDFLFGGEAGANSLRPQKENRRLGFAHVSDGFNHVLG